MVCCAKFALVVVSTVTGFVAGACFWAVSVACSRRLSSMSCASAEEMLERIWRFFSVRFVLRRATDGGAANDVVVLASVMFSCRRSTVRVAVVDIVEVWD